MINVVLVIQRFHPYSKVGARRWSKFMNVLQHNNNLRFTVITQDHHISNENNWNVTLDPEKITIHRLSGINEWLATYIPFSGLLIRLIEWFKFKVLKYTDEGYGFSKHAFSYLERHRNEIAPAVIIASSPAYSTCYFAAKFKAKHPEIKLINDFRDAWIDGFFSWNKGDETTHPNYLQQVQMEDYALNNCDAVVSVTPELLQKLKNKIREPKTQTHLITNGFDPSDRLNKTPLKPKEFSEDKINICHFGTLDFGREDEFLKFLNCARSNPNLQFFLIGSCSTKLINAIKDHHNVIMIGHIQQSCLQAYLFHADFHLIVNDKEFYYAYGSKIYDAILYKKPIVYITRSNSMVEHLERYGVVIHTNGSLEANQDALSKIKTYQPPANYPAMEEFSIPRLAGEYSELIKNLCVN